MFLKLSAHEITVAEWVILREMYTKKNELVAPSTIAKLTGLSHGAVSKLIDRLVHKNLVLRSEAKTDRRYQEIRLDSCASELVPKLAALADENDHHFFSVLSAEEQQQLKHLLAKLAQTHQLITTPIE